MLKMVILICALGVSQPDCSIESADVVIQGPETSNGAMCGLHGQAYLASTAVADYLDGEHYLKLVCTAEATPGGSRQITGGPAARVLLLD